MVKYTKDYRWIDKPPLTLKIGQRWIGHIGEGRVFIQYGTSEKHHLQKPRGWALDARAVEDLEKMGILFVERGKLRANLVDFRLYGQRINRDHGEQIVLPDRHWYSKDAEPRPVQMQMM